MPGTGWTPSIVPYGADLTIYDVADRFGGLGSVSPETEVERTDLETIIADLMTGQFNDPVRVVAFSTLNHWAPDVEALEDFVDSYVGPDRQLALRLV